MKTEEIPSFRTLVTRYLDGVADESETASLGRVLAGDDAAADLFAAESLLHHDLAFALSGIAGRRKAWQAGSESVVLPAPRRPLARRMVAMAALIAALAAVGALLLERSKRAPETALAPEAVGRNPILAAPAPPAEVDPSRPAIAPSRVEKILAQYVLPEVTVQDLSFADAIRAVEGAMHEVAFRHADADVLALRFEPGAPEPNGEPLQLLMRARELPALLQINYLAAMAGKRVRFVASGVEFETIPEEEAARIASVAVPGGEQEWQNARLANAFASEPPSEWIANLEAVAEGAAFPSEGDATFETNALVAAQTRAFLAAVAWEPPKMRVTSKIVTAPASAFGNVAAKSEGSERDAEIHEVAGKTGLPGGLMADHVFADTRVARRFLSRLAKEEGTVIGDALTSGSMAGRLVDLNGRMDAAGETVSFVIDYSASINLIAGQSMEAGGEGLILDSFDSGETTTVVNISDLDRKIVTSVMPPPAGEVVEVMSYDEADGSLAEVASDSGVMRSGLEINYLSGSVDSLAVAVPGSYEIAPAWEFVGNRARVTGTANRVSPMNALFPDGNLWMDIPLNVSFTRPSFVPSPPVPVLDFDTTLLPGQTAMLELERDANGNVSLVLLSLEKGE